MPSSEHDGLVHALLSAPAGIPTVDEFRTNFPVLVGASGVAEGRQIQDQAINGVTCVRVAGDAGLPVLLWVHGGGLIAGTAGAHAAPLSHLFARIPTVVIDYRLAPEHPLPKPLDDVLSVYRGLVDAGTGPIVLGGDSVGAGLALLAATMLLEAGDLAPVGLALISPWTDFAVSEALADLVDEPDPLVNREGLQAMSGAFRGSDSDEWLLSRREVKGLPPVHIEYGSREVLRVDVEALTDRLDSEGVAVTPVCSIGLVHIYPILLPRSPEGRAAGERLTRFVELCGSEVAS